MFYVFSILVTVVNWTDYILTQKLLSLSGYQESNPILRKLNMFWVKLVINIFLIVITYLTHWLFLVIPTIILLFACVWNGVLLYKHYRG